MSNIFCENRFEWFLTLFFDIVIFFVKTIFHYLESLYLSILPNAFRKEKDLNGQIVLITGGGGGVGRQLAINFAQHKAKVIIWDINNEAIETTKSILEEQGYVCYSYIVDISDSQQVFDMAKKVKNEIGNVDILINNAGIVCCKPFWELSEKIIQNTFAVNILSNYWTIKAFLPDMMEKNQGHIVTLGSVAGLIGTYACSDYSATKFACAGFHESLYTDLKAHGYDNIHLTLVCPYFIDTGMFSGVQPRILPMLKPKSVADKIITSVKRNEVNCIIPDSVRLLLPLKCLLPAKSCWELMIRVMKGPQSMMLFKRRGKVFAG